MLVDGGKMTSVSYISNTMPIPADKAELAVCTAIAGEMLGLHLLYLDAGSGAKSPIPVEMTQAVGKTVQIPLIVGGGLRTSAQINAQFTAGADLVVVGNVLEKNPGLLTEISNGIARS